MFTWPLRNSTPGALFTASSTVLTARRAISESDTRATLVTAWSRSCERLAAVTTMGPTVATHGWPHRRHRRQALAVPRPGRDERRPGVGLRNRPSRREYRGRGREQGPRRAVPQRPGEHPRLERLRRRPGLAGVAARGRRARESGRPRRHRLGHAAARRGGPRRGREGRRLLAIRLGGVRRRRRSEERRVGKE